jgi:phage repressor protein C with HTH and peptisase S24 domain
MLFGHMVAAARAKRELSLRDLARRVGTSAATLSKIENLGHIPRDSAVRTLIAVLAMDPERTWRQVARERLARYPAGGLSDDSSPLVPVPIIGKVTAGSRIEAPAWSDGGFPAGSGFDAEMVPLRPDEGGLYGLTVEGDSMEPVFSRGDYVFAAPNKEPRLNGFAVVRLKSGEVLLKKVIIGPEWVVLQSANPAYATISVARGEIEYIHPITMHRLA